MPPIQRGEVWWVSFDPSVGGEIRKTRPAVVVSNNGVNEILNRVAVVPLSRQIRKIYPGEAPVTVAGTPAKAMADQIMTVSKLRLRQRLGALTATEVRAVEDAILVHLGIWR